MIFARRIIPFLAVALLAGIPAVGATDTPEPVVAEDGVVDDRLQILVDRLHAEADKFFGGDYHSISVIRLSDGHRVGANGDERHVSLSAAKAPWVAIAIAEFGVDAVEPFAAPIFVNSSNRAAARVLSLFVPNPEAPTDNNEGVNAVNAAMWSWGTTASYLYAWYGPQGQSYGYHRSSEWLGGFPVNCCVEVWGTANFMSTNDLSMFWATVAGGEILDEADTAQFLEWASLPRYEGSGMITPRLPNSIAATVAHKAGWNGAHTRRIDGGVVTTPSGEQFAIAISFRLNTDQTYYWSRGALDWGRYATCEVYNEIASTSVNCTKSGDPYEVIDHTTVPIGNVTSIVADRTKVEVRGWALDSDSGADPIDVRITVDGTKVGTLTADQLSTSVHDLHGMGNYHGFEGSIGVSLTPGPHEICAVALNDGGGSNKTIECTDIAVPSDKLPKGSFSLVRVEPARFVVRGRASDADTDGPIKVTIKVDGKKVRRFTANQGTSGRKFLHRINVALSPGEHTICAVALNFEGNGPNRNLGCRVTTVPEDWPPVGNLLNAAADGTSVWVRGKARDYDLAGAIEVRIEVDGTEAGSIFATAGPLDRKYNGTVAAPLDPGPHTVCTIAVNHLGGEPTTPLGCLEVVVSD